MLDPAAEATEQIPYDQAVFDLGKLPRRSPDAQYRAMNADHREELIVNELLADLTLAPISAHLNKPGDPFRDVDGLGILTNETFFPIVIMSKSDKAQKFWNLQLRDVLASSTERRIRVDEIVLQQQDILSYLSLPVRLGPVTHPWMLAFLSAVHAAAVKIGIQAKAMFDFPRPVDHTPLVTPIIQTPAHSAFPSGHAIESFALATAIEKLVKPTPKGICLHLARRIAQNRVIAGVHYPIDGEAGALIGRLIGTIAITRLTGRELSHSFTPIILPVTDGGVFDEENNTTRSFDPQANSTSELLQWLNGEIEIELSR